MAWVRCGLVTVGTVHGLGKVWVSYCRYCAWLVYGVG